MSAWRPDPDVERANALDRAWFAGHPGETVYFRAPVLGEFDVLVEKHVFPLNATEIALVLVEQIAPGVRWRTGLPFIEHLP